MFQYNQELVDILWPICIVLLVCWFIGFIVFIIRRQ